MAVSLTLVISGAGIALLYAGPIVVSCVLVLSLLNRLDIPDVEHPKVPVAEPKGGEL